VPCPWPGARTIPTDRPVARGLDYVRHETNILTHVDAPCWRFAVAVNATAKADKSQERFLAAYSIQYAVCRERLLDAVCYILYTG